MFYKVGSFSTSTSVLSELVRACSGVISSSLLKMKLWTCRFCSRFQWLLFLLMEVSGKFWKQRGYCQGRGTEGEPVQLGFSLASYVFEASQQLSVQAVGSRCRGASLSSQLCRGKMSVHNAAFVIFILCPVLMFRACSFYRSSFCSVLPAIPHQQTTASMVFYLSHFTTDRLESVYD